MNIPERDGDGYLVDSSGWTPEIARAMAHADGVDLDDAQIAALGLDLTGLDAGR